MPSSLVASQDQPKGVAMAAQSMRRTSEAAIGAKITGGGENTNSASVGTGRRVTNLRGVAMGLGKTGEKCQQNVARAAARARACHANAVKQTLVALILGVAISLVGSIPMTGPNAALVVQRLLDQQRTSAFLVALGAAVGEVFYAAVVALPLPYALARYQSLVPWSRLAGAVAVGLVGLLLLLRPKLFKSEDKPQPQASFAAGFAVAAFNPTLFATWTAVCATLYANGWLAPRVVPGLAFAVGAGVGVIVWFYLIALFLPRWAPHLGGQRQAWIMRGLGGLMIIAAIWLAARTPMPA